jgi:hypothetical protein
MLTILFTFNESDKLLVSEFRWRCRHQEELEGAEEQACRVNDKKQTEILMRFRTRRQVDFATGLRVGLVAARSENFGMRV